MGRGFGFGKHTWRSVCAPGLQLTLTAYHYARIANPTNTVFEDRMAALEGVSGFSALQADGDANPHCSQGIGAIATASGQSATVVVSFGSCLGDDRSAPSPATTLRRPPADLCTLTLDTSGPRKSRRQLCRLHQALRGSLTLPRRLTATDSPLGFFHRAVPRTSSTPSFRD